MEKILEDIKLQHRQMTNQHVNLPKFLSVASKGERITPFIYGTIKDERIHCLNI